MKMILHPINALLIVGASAMVLSITGCGGGGSGTPIPTPNLTPTPGPVIAGEVVAGTDFSLEIFNLYSANKTTIPTVARPTDVSWFPGNQQIAYTQYRGGDIVTSSIHRINRDGTADKEILPRKAFSPAVSPDGTRIAYTTGVPEWIIYVANVDGKGPTKVGIGDNPSWSPDSSRLIFLNLTRAGIDLHTVKADGSGEIRLTNTPNLLEEEARFSPTGDRIAYTASPDGNDPEIYIMNADGSNSKKITNSKDNAFGDFNPRWTRDGKRIAYLHLTPNSTDLYTINVDGTNPVRAHTFGSTIFSFDLR